MRTNAASSVKDGRYYLQLAGAEARERLMLAAAKEWGVPVDEVTAKDSVLSHSKSGRSTTYGKIAHLAARTPHPNPEAIALKPPEMWTLMGTEQKNLDVPSKVTGQTVYGIDVRLPGMKWAAVKSCPVYGGDASFDSAAVAAARRALRASVPDSRLEAHARARVQRRRRRRRGYVVSGEDGARRDADRVDGSAGARRVQHREHAYGASRGARRAGARARELGRCRRRL
jgi:isoquinoline 1-oxidoreductase beta subunit